MEPRLGSALPNRARQGSAQLHLGQSCRRSIQMGMRRNASGTKIGLLL